MYSFGFEKNVNCELIVFNSLCMNTLCEEYYILCRVKLRAFRNNQIDTDFGFGYIVSLSFSKKCSYSVIEIVPFIFYFFAKSPVFH